MFLLQLMIIVDEAGGLIPAINHSPWNGLTLADFVLPFFLFMVGVSLALVYKVLNIYLDVGNNCSVFLTSLNLMIPFH